MKHLSIFSILILSALYTRAQALRQTQQALKRSVVNEFFTCPLDQMLDTLSGKYNIPIFFERDTMAKYDISDHFFEESLLSVIKAVCRSKGLRYWIANDGTLYIMQQPDDLPRLQQLRKLSVSTAAIKPRRLDPPKGPPKHFKFTLTGRVTDQSSGEALPGAVVKIRHTDLSVNTNVNGSFTLFNVPSDTAVVEVSYVGFQSDAFRLNSSIVNDPLSLALYPSMNSLNEVTINGKKSGVLNTDSKQVSIVQLNPAQLEKLPSLGERDIMRSFQLMPGISATNESSSGAYVRGGTPDQNLVTLDGFTVYQVDHLYGFFSAFNSNAIRDVTLYKGGYSAKYGGRLSSVTEIRGKDGSKKDTIIGGDIGLLSTNLYAEGPVNDKSSALIAFRRSYQGPFYNKIFSQFNSSAAVAGPPGGGPGGFKTTPSSNFYDLNAKYTYTKSAQTNYAFSFYSGADKVDNGREFNPPFASSSTDIKINDLTKSGNIGTSFKMSNTLSPSLSGNTVLSYSTFFSNRDRGSSSVETGDNTKRTIDNTTAEHNRLHDVTLKSDWELQYSPKFRVLYGGYGSFLNIKYQYTQSDTALINQNNSGMLAGAYTELDLNPTSYLHLQPGIRYTYFSPTGKGYAEPRLSGTLHLSDEFQLKGATGRFYQFTNQVIREDVAGGNRNFWVLSNNNNIPVGRADHFIGGFSYETNSFLIDVEGYYKRLSGLTEYSIIQSGGGMRPGASSSASSITENFYNGSGYSKGLEVLLQKKVGLYTGWISYTLGEAKSKFPNYGDSYFPSDQDIRHEFKSINMYHYQRWSFSAVFIFSTGHPYTAPLSSYSINTADGNRITYLTVSGKNAERLPAYHRLDLSATYDLLKIDGKKTGSIGFSLFNVYNHVNSWYNEYYLQDNKVITTQVKYLGFTPNIILSLKFK